jgi:signal transduction histidine kinase
MEMIQYEIKKLIKKIIIVYFLFLFLLLNFVFFIQFQLKNQIIESTTKLSREFIVNDNKRELLKSLTQIMDHFNRISFESLEGKILLILPDQNTHSKYFYKSIKEIIYLDVEKKIGLAALTFEYNPWPYLVISFIFWILLTITAVPWFNSSKQKITLSYNQKVDIEKNRLMTELAKQVSHDVRSPLAALNMIIGSLKDIPEDRRITMRSAANRINDIANELLTKGQVHQNLNSKNKLSQAASLKNQEQDLTIELLPAVIDLLVSEKRIQYREKSTVTIETNFDESYGAFAKINSSEFKRVWSHTITNAVEALNRHDGKIIISVKNYKAKTIVSIRDNGGGIPAAILTQLGKMGVTYGKEGTDSGSGLGVYHAKKTIESFGAQFEIQSREGLGTEVIMNFPKCEIPLWFVPQIEIIQNQFIVALDDEVSVLEIWKQRVKELNLPSVQLIALTSENDFIDWIAANKIHINETLFLMDYELLGQKNSGLDLIEKYNLNSNAILVTSRYEEPQIRLRCSNLNVRQIPKSMASLVPLTEKLDP